MGFPGCLEIDKTFTRMSAPTCEIIVGDCLESLRRMPDCSVDSIVTDPPYGLSKGKKGGSGDASMNTSSPAGRSRVTTGGGFMGLAWDADVPPVEVWIECLRVLKPGGHLLAFAGTRTQHRMACRIEDAGFEIRDMIAWVYGSGFPKSLDVSKAIDKAAGVEREVIGTGKPVKRMIPGADQIEGGSWIKDNGREFVPTETAPATDAAREWDGWGSALKPALEPITLARKPLDGTIAANVLKHGTGALNVDGCRVEGGERPLIESRADSALNAFGDGLNGSRCAGTTATGRFPANLIHDGSDEVIERFPSEAGAAAPVHRRNADKFRNTFRQFAGNVDEAGSTFHGDSGSAARFFYCAKASADDRGADNKHPTVKPNALMRYLCRLITPPGGTVLDPYLGSGSTAKAALEEGFSIIGMEIDPDHAATARTRCNVTPGLSL